MKKLLSILLTLSVICSLIVMPAMNVSAAETVLFEEAKTEVVVEQDFSKWSDSSDLATNSATGTGSISETHNSAATGHYSFAVQEDGALKVTLDAKDVTTPMIRLNINPSQVDANMKQISTTFKIKRDLFDTTGTKVETAMATTSEFVGLGNRVELTDGTTAYMAAARMDNLGGMYKIPSGVKIGSCTAGGGYGRTNGTDGATAAVDDEGYFNLEIRSYLTSGEYYSAVYDASTGTLLKNIYYNKSTGGIEHNAVGAYIEINLATNSVIRGYTSEVYIKDVKTTYEYDAIGSIATAGSTTYSYDDTTDTYYITNKPASGASGHRVTFNIPSTLTEGRVVTDFSIKNEGPVVNETGTNSSVKQIVTGNGTVIGAFDMATSTKVGAWNSSNDGYRTDTGFRTYQTAEISMTCVGGWSDLRVVAMSNTEGKWTYALYDRNKSLTKPIYLRVTTDTTYKGIGLGYYLYGDGRGASTADSTIPKVSIPITIKNLDIYTQDTYGIETNITRTGLSYSGAPYTVKTDTTGIRFDGVIHVQTPTTARVVFAVYDENNNEIRRVVKELGSGIYLYNSSNVFGVSDLEDNTNVYANVYVENGTDKYSIIGNNVGQSEYVVGNTGFETSAEFGYAAEGDALKTLRFYFTPSFKTTMEITDFGAYIIPFGLFNESDVTSESTELITATAAGLDPSTLVSGEMFGAELNDVPTEYEEITIVGMPFIAIDGEYVWGDRLDVIPADVMVK